MGEREQVRDQADLERGSLHLVVFGKDILPKEEMVVPLVVLMVDRKLKHILFCLHNNDA